MPYLCGTRCLLLGNIGILKKDDVKITQTEKDNDLCASVTVHMPVRLRLLKSLTAARRHDGKIVPNPYGLCSKVKYIAYRVTRYGAMHAQVPP